MSASLRSRPNLRTAANRRGVPILLQKSQIARRQFSCCKKIRPTTADRCGLNHVTEVASEFIFRHCGPPHIYTKGACTAKRNFDHECKKTFATKSATSRAPQQ